MGIFSIFVLPFLFIVVLIIFLDKKSKAGFLQKLIVSSVFLLPFTYDIVITNILATYYCYTSPNPKTKIEKKVEYPISIYWEDNVYPGFSIEDRKLMIINYLDGVHLKKMALNGDDGKIYIYSLEKPILSEIKKEFSEQEWYTQGKEKYTQTVMQTEQVYTKNTMPKLNYTVTFNEVKLNSFISKFLYSDETKIIENNTSQVIAFNQRYMRFFYNILPDIALGNIYYSYLDPMCGSRFLHYDGDDFGYIANYSKTKHETSLNRFLYIKYIIKGEK